MSLFSGIGGLDLAAESCGIETAAFCEIEPYAVKVLERRWPGVQIIDDVRKIKGCDWPVDVVHGGFPCQDLSQAGKQAGLEGARSGLWFEMLRVIAECRPRYVLAENVRGAVNLALDTVYSGMVGEGYKVYPYVIPASAVGAPHRRERLFVIGIRKDVADRLCLGSEAGIPRQNARKEGESNLSDYIGEDGGAFWPTPCSRGNDGGGPIGLGGGARARRNLDESVGEDARKKLCSGSLNPAWVEILMGFPLGWTDVDCEEPEPWPGWPMRLWAGNWPTPQCFDATAGDLKGKEYTGKNRHALKLGNCINAQTGQYSYEPPRIVTGCRNRAKRLKCLGNAVVPQQAVPIFEAIRQIHNHITCECFT